MESVAPLLVRGPAFTPALVGRQHELDEVRGALDDVVAGRGRFFLLVGEPGIGKTSLADAIAAAAAERGFVTAWGRCWEGGGAPPLFPWTQVFAAIGRPVPDATAASALDS
jgi:predicted ATPase